MATDDLRAVLKEPFPCANCISALRCKTQELACEAFARFLDGDPSWRTAPRMPTAMRYRDLMGDEDDE
jgi:hypothetical protein